jgi:cysteine desulfurase
MFANNEIGTIQPIQEIGEFAKSKGVPFHVDAAQAVGHEKIHVYDMNIDLMSFSAHKFYGPKGVGGLFVRSFAPMVRLSPVSFGGGHERGMRPGTLNVPGIVGMAAALDLAVKEQPSEQIRLQKFRSVLTKKLLTEFSEIKCNGHPEHRLAHNLSLTLPGIESKALMHILKNKLSFSAGSACSAIKVQPSHVLLATGLNETECYQTIRLGLGRSTVAVNEIAEALLEGIRQLQK